MHYARIKNDVVTDICFFTDDTLVEKFLDGFDGLVPLHCLDEVKPGYRYDSKANTFAFVPEEKPVKAKSSIKGAFKKKFKGNA